MPSEDADRSGIGEAESVGAQTRRPNPYLRLRQRVSRQWRLEQSSAGVRCRSRRFHNYERLKMLKRDELENPRSCMSRALDHEWTFVLLARDAAAPAAIRAWVDERIRLDKNTPTDDQILEALRCASLMEKQREAGVLK